MPTDPSDTPVVDDLPQRIASKIRFTPSCWEWTAMKTDRGYGRVRWNGPLAYAHRVVYELLVGPVLAGQYISKGHRQCRECHRQRGRRYYREARAS